MEINLKDISLLSFLVTTNGIIRRHSLSQVIIILTSTLVNDNHQWHTEAAIILYS